MMVKLICAIVDIAGAAFPIDIDTNELVGDFKKVIKAENSRTIACDANDLRLFLAKTDGRWLTEFEVQNGVADISVFEELDVVGAPLNMIGLSEETVSSVAITKELVKAKKTPLHVLVVPSEPVQLQRKLWLVTGTVVNALGSKGIRRHLHLMASLHIGFYDPTRRVDNKNVAFWYEAKNLCFHVLFKSKYEALKFETDLRTGPQTLGSPLTNLDVEARVSPATTVSITLERIFLDYYRDDLKSPQDTASSVSLSSIASFLDATTDEFRFQRIEHEKLFLPYGKAESFHLVSRKKSRDHKREFAKYDRDPNNRLALSRDMSGWYDGVSVDVPIVNMLPGMVEKNPSIGSRRKVEVFVKVVDVRCADRVFNRLKDGSTSTTDPLMMKTFVHVENPDAFCLCLKRKYHDNEERARDFFDMTSAVD